MLKVFFGCSMRGGQSNVSREDLAIFPLIIEELGYEVASKHQTEAGIIEEENKKSKTYIHDRDYKWLMESDLGIFEISNASLGVGGEISDMANLNKPVLCIFKAGMNINVSAYIQGKQGSKYVKAAFECRAYESADEAKNIIKQFIGSLLSRPN